MVDAFEAFQFVVALLPFAAMAAAVVYAGYVAYETRLERERQALEPRLPPVDYAAEMRRLNAAAVAGLAEARGTLEKTRETLRRGIRG